MVGERKEFLTTPSRSSSLCLLPLSHSLGISRSLPIGTPGSQPGQSPRPLGLGMPRRSPLRREATMGRSSSQRGRALKVSTLTAVHPVDFLVSPLVLCSAPPTPTPPPLFSFAHCTPSLPNPRQLKSRGQLCVAAFTDHKSDQPPRISA